MTDASPGIPLATRPRRRISIRAALLLAVNGVLITGLAAGLIIDYQGGLAERLADRQTAMGDEAALVLTAVAQLRHHGLQVVQDYIDRACAQMQDASSPGHHIAVGLDQTMLQAQTHHRASPAFAQAMQRAAASGRNRAQMDGRSILVGTRGDDAARVYVAEFTTDVHRAARAQLLSRAGGIALLGLLLTAVVNLILLRLVTGPTQRLVGMVRRIGAGELGQSPPYFATAEWDFLARELGQMSRSLAQADRGRRVQMAKARQIQQNLLPRPDHLQTVGIHHVHLPAQDVGGDFFDVKIIDEHRLVLYMGDVTGHGIPAAMSAGMLKVLFEEQYGQALSDPAAVLGQINRRFHAVTLDGDFATMFMGIIDRRLGRLIYASAGHEIGYVMHRTGQLDELSTTGMPLGVDPRADYDLAGMDIEPGDALVLLTDGLVETLSPQGRLLGRKALPQALRQHGGDSAQELAARLLRLADAHRGPGPQLDDITLAVLRV
ncbi:MAG: PP2C family protein-serine/threonine phosphatase [Phycisphaeraceae bacterium]